VLLRSFTWAPAALLLVACGSGPSEPPATPLVKDPPKHKQPSPYPKDPWNDPAPTLDTAKMSTLLPKTLATVASFRPTAIRGAYDKLFAHSDETCPGIIETKLANGDINRLWGNTCTTKDGTTITGDMDITTIDHQNADGSKETGYTMASNSFTIVAPNGESMHGAIFFDVRVIAHQGYTIFQATFSGDVVSDGKTAAGDPWLSGAVKGPVNIYAVDAAKRSLNLSSSLTASTMDAAVSAFDIASITVDESPCALAAHGTGSVRDSNGSWHDVDLGTPDDNDPTKNCNACGDLSYYGKPLGSFCSDPSSLSSLLAWKQIPW
jgi:hypothetical protein